ncbi:Ubiquitin carboxyl-terminal hydrolase [Abeliophyllum distichum]|uniref:Ubiquitin carboxyl-terminal hydrolase n=1 Tax=Abeliophyllum distichum TaxID=126358 RepID=A0ABD1T1V2_9LAMI
MDSLLFSSTSQDDDVFTPFDHSFSPLQQPSLSNSTYPLFLVPFRWWKEAREAVYSGGSGGLSGGGVLYNGTARVIDAFDEEGGMTVGRRDLEILLSMRREGESKISEEERVSSEGGFCIGVGVDVLDSS